MLCTSLRPPRFTVCTISTRSQEDCARVSALEAEEDFAGIEYMDEQRFHESIFEMVDLYTETIDPDEYVDFLSILLTDLIAVGRLGREPLARLVAPAPTAESRGAADGSDATGLLSLSEVSDDFPPWDAAGAFGRTSGPGESVAGSTAATPPAPAPVPAPAPIPAPAPMGWGGPAYPSSYPGLNPGQPSVYHASRSLLVRELMTDDRGSRPEPNLFGPEVTASLKRFQENLSAPSQPHPDLINPRKRPGSSSGIHDGRSLAVLTIPPKAHPKSRPNTAASDRAAALTEYRLQRGEPDTFMKREPKRSSKEMRSSRSLDALVNCSNLDGRPRRVPPWQPLWQPAPPGTYSRPRLANECGGKRSPRLTMSSYAADSGMSMAPAPALVPPADYTMRSQRVNRDIFAIRDASRW